MINMQKKKREIYLQFSVLGLTAMESLLKNRTLDDGQTSGHLLSEGASC